MSMNLPVISITVTNRIDNGVRRMRFTDLVLRSSAADGAWVDRPS